MLGGSAVDEQIATALKRRKGGGESLPSALSSQLGEQVGMDLSALRMHTDPAAAQISQSLQATAFTHGSDVYFAPGAYRPGSPDGQRLIAHEVSHVAAQRSGADTATGGALTVGKADDPAEIAADRSADSMMSALRRSTGRGAPPALHAGGADLSALRRSTFGVVRRDGPVVMGGHRAPQQKAEPETNGFDSGIGSFSGTKTKTESVDQTRKGGSEGSRTTTTKKGVVGAWNKGETSTDVRNGLSTKKTSTSIDNLAGAEAWGKVIRESSDAQLLAAFAARARTGAFSKGGGEATYERGQLSTGAKGSYDAMAGLDTGVQGHAKVDKTGLFPALEAAVSAYAKGGVGLDAEAEVFARLWKLEFVATGKVSLFAGFEASASGKVYANLKDGIGAEGKISGFAGARGSAEGTATLKLGPAELMVMASIEGKAGVWGSAAGKVAISFTGVEVSGEAEAFAGVKASATGEAALKFRGKSLISAKGTVTAAAGIGGKVSGKFVLKGGKLSINFGALAVKGIGGGVDVGLDVDLYALGDAICTTIWEEYTNYTNTITEDAGYIPRDVIIDAQEAAKVEKQAYDAYIFDFRSYAAAKQNGTGKTGLNRTRVQTILDQRRGQLGTALTHVEADLGIDKAAREAFGPLLKDIVIRGGKIVGWGSVGASEIAGVREQLGKDAATGDLQAALQAGAAQSRAGGPKGQAGSHTPDFASINKILKSHAPKVLAAHGNDQQAADAAIAGLVESAYKGFWEHVVVTGGKVTSAKVDLQAISQADDSAAQVKTSMDRVGALAKIQSACAAYAAGQAKSKKGKITKDEVLKIITENAGSLTTAKDQSVADSVIADMVIRGLGSSIVKFSYAGGKILDPFEAADQATVHGAFLADADAQRRSKLYEDAKTEMSAYAAKKTKTGENGVKPAGIQKIVTGVVKSVGPANIGEADIALTSAAQNSLASMINHIEITDGVVTMVVSQTKTKSVKDKFATDKAGKGKFLGEGEANERRYTVSRLVRGPITTYAGGIRSDPHGVPTLQEIQKVVDDSMKGFGEQLKFDDAREYLVQVIIEAFDGVVSITADKDGRLIRPAFDMTRLMELRSKDTSKASSAKALKALAGPLKAYAAQTAKGRPTMSDLQAAMDKGLAKAGTGDQADLDRFCQQAIMEAFGSMRIKSVTVEGGTITVLKLGR